MYFKINFKLLVLTFVMLVGVTNVQGQCYPGQIVTAAYATGGASPYVNDVLWLTWGSENQKSHPYGMHDQRLTVGSKSRASIDLGDGKFLCIEAEIKSISANSGTINSYAPGNYSGDYLDDLYNIGGVGSNNKLVSGIQTEGNAPKITIECRATLDGKPIRIPGLVLADAESLNGSGEYIYATADGDWTLVEVKKNIGAGAYEVIKQRPSSGSSIRTMKFLKGNDNNTMAVAFLKFNESAYKGPGNLNPDLSVTIEVDFQGGGKTAIALGLLAPEVDGGDAPASYGNPLHLIQKLSFTSDGISVGNSTSTNSTNINTSNYTPGALVPNTNLSHLGTTAPDTETIALNSRDALGDDNSGPAGSKEEDAWPEAYKRFSYKVDYQPGKEINASIPYRSWTNGYIAGWIDFNLNGVFDPGEKQEIYAPSTGGAMRSVMLKWIIPGTRKPYSTYVRLRLSEYPNMTPDSFLNTGEVEDHRIFILSPAVTNPMIHSRAKEKSATN